MSDLQSTTEISWFYTENGERKGPVSEREMIRLITSSVIFRGVYIWNKGLPNWLKVENTYLHTHLDNSVPPPMPGRNVNPPMPGRRINPNMPGVGLSRVVYILLAFFLGALGVHNFAAGYVGKGVAQLLITVLIGWLIIPLLAVWIWTIVEMATVTKSADGTPFS